MNKMNVKKRFDDVYDRLMDNPVTNGRLVDLPLLGIENGERMVRTVAIIPGEKIIAQTKQMVFKIAAKFHYVFP